MRGHGQIYLERESTDMRSEYSLFCYYRYSYSYYTYLKGFCGYSFSLCIHLTHITDSGEHQLLTLALLASHLFSTRRLVLTRISCIKLTESKRATDVPLGNSFSIKGAHGLSDCLGRCYGVTEQVTETQQDTAQSLSLPLLSFFLSCTLEPCGSQVGVAQAPGQAVMYLTAPWSRPEGGQGSAWRGCSHTAPNRSSIWVFIHLSSSVGRPWPLAAHQPVTSSPLELPWATFDRHWPLLTGKNKSCTITQILTFACLLCF